MMGGFGKRKPKRDDRRLSESITIRVYPEHKTRINKLALKSSVSQVIRGILINGLEKMERDQ